MRLSGGIFHRTADKVIMAEVKSTYADLPVKGDVVLDVGANIGAASRLFLDRGARKVIAIEPDPTNMALLRRNLAKRPAVVIWAAAGANPGRERFHMHTSKPYLSSLLEDKGRHSIMVPVVPLGALFAQYAPSVVKVDIEFGEYDLPELHYLPDFVRSLALEVHVRYDLVFKHKTQTDAELRDRRQQAADLIAAIEAQGFTRASWKVKRAKDRPIEDDTGLAPLTKSIDAVWTR